MKLRLTILCENSVGRPLGLIGEHGFSCHLETPAGNYLFDTGSGLGIETNARLLNINLEELQGIILSHGHYDHVGGLPQILIQTGPIDVYGHPDMFKPRYSVSGEQKREIGIPHNRSYLEQLGARFHLSSESVELAPGLVISGEIPRTTDFEQGDANLCCPAEDGSLQPDKLKDDLSLYITTEQGLTVLLGCAHAGVINILKHARILSGEQNIHSVIGGTHLMFYDDNQFQQTLEQLDSYGIEKLGAAHCTGLQQAAKLAAHFGERFFFASAGCTVEI